jgi:RNA polymerase sigma-70 factor (ECF subfamily)
MENAPREDWFRHAMDEHMGIFLKTAHGFTVNAADRDDLVQEMLIAVWQALPTYRPDACKLSTYLYRIAHNRALNWQRSRTRYHRKLERFAEYPHLALAAGDSADRQHQLDWLYALIRQLPPADRTLIMLQLDQLTHREIAEITGLTDSNVGVRLHRIKQWLSAQTKETAHEL